MSNDNRDISAADISELQESFSKQQKKISVLKELVRKSEKAHSKTTSSAQEKVKNIAVRLTQLKSKATRGRFDEDQICTDIAPDPVSSKEQHTKDVVDDHFNQSQLSFASPRPSHVSTPNPTPIQTKQHTESITPHSANVSSGAEKIMLLRQQMEQNKVLMAQRASSKQHLEQLVTQLKEKFDTTQQCLDNTAELGKSMTDLSALATYTPVTRERYKSATDLAGQQAFSLERERIKFLENRCRLLEKQLEKEKQNNNSDNLILDVSKIEDPLKERILHLEKTIHELQLTTEEREKSLLEENSKLLHQIKVKEEGKLFDPKINEEEFKDMFDLKQENETLRQKVSEHIKRIIELEKENDLLEKTRCDLTEKNHHFEAQIQDLQQFIENSKEELSLTHQELHETKAKLDILQQKQQTEQNVKVSNEMASAETDAQIKAEMAKQIQELQDQLEPLRLDNQELQQQLNDRANFEVLEESVAAKIVAFEATIERQREELLEHTETIKKQEEDIMEKTIELNVLNANFKVLEEKLEANSKNKALFSTMTGDNANSAQLEQEVQQLKQKLDESNKAMIKLKLKSKQTEKQMEKLKKGSDLHSEVVKLNKDIEMLQQKITELEDEKGQWQLSQVEEHKKTDVVVQSNQLEELQQKCERLTELNDQLEEQKSNEAMQLNETVRVKSELTEIKFEEELSQTRQSLQELQTKFKEKETELEILQMQKQEVDKKLEHYIHDNIELLDKLEKLSKSSSSAESIEIVERLTQQERAEIEEYNNQIENPDHTPTSVSELTQTDISPELNDSLVKLRDESAELMNKIELFTTERREVLEKMEHLTTENIELLKKIEEITEQKELLSGNLMLAENDKLKIEDSLRELTKEKEQLANQLAESTANKSNLSQELSSMHKSTEVVPSIDPVEGASLFDKCEKSLSKLNSELEAYRKANDKNSKFNVSKKLAKEAKNAYTQLSELLQKVRESSTAVETVTVVETVVAVTAANGEALAEYEQLTKKNRDLQSRVEQLQQQLEEAERIPEIEPIQEQPTAKKIREDTEETLVNYEIQCIELQSLVENLRRDLQEARLASEDKSAEIERLDSEIQSLQKISKDFDILLSDKEMAQEKQVEHMKRLRREVEAKCETYEGEMEILQTLVAEQKQQLIEAYKEHEHEINLKLLDLEQRDKLIMNLRLELADIKKASEAIGEQFAVNMSKECDKLREDLKANKALVSEQLIELANKQETIDTLNQQLIDLYKTMEDNANKVLEKDDELQYLQELLDTNNKEVERLVKDNDEQKHVVDKLLTELHSHQTATQQLPHLETDLKNLQKINRDLEQSKHELEQKNREQMEKLKKFAVSLKKRNAQYQELEKKLHGQTQNEHGNDEFKIKLEAKLDELQTALEAKTVEHLKALEHSDALEIQLNELRACIEEKSNEYQQLQTASSDWSTDANNEELLEKTEQLNFLHKKLMETQNQLANEHSQIEQLQRQLADESQSKTEQINIMKQQNEQLNSIESNFNQIQSELLQLRIVKADLEQVVLEKNQQIEKLENKTTQLINIEHQTLTLEKRVTELTEELKAKSLKFEKSKAVIKDRNNQIQRLQAQLKEMQDQLSKQPEEEPTQVALQQSQTESIAGNSSHYTKAQYEQLQSSFNELSERYSKEKSSFEATIARLNTLHDGIQAKLQEDMSYIETIELENTKFKDKICKLEECVASFEDRRASMERRVNLMDEQMHERADQYEKTEDELIYRLNALSEHDEVIAQRLYEAENEKEELNERLKHLQNESKEILSKYTQLQSEYQNYKVEAASNEEIEMKQLKEQLKTSQTEMQRMRSVYDAQLAAKITELDELECELSEQLEKMNAEHRALNADLEKARDTGNEQMDEIVRLRENVNNLEQAKHELEREATWLRMQQENAQQDQYELQELRMQSIQDKTELENLCQKVDTLTANHEIELQALRTQISELDTLRMQVGQNQTDDQVFIETENKRLTDLLVEKEAIIENYQRQNLQLQMMAASSAQLPASSQQHNTQNPLALAFGLPPAALTSETNEVQTHLQRELLEKSNLIANMQAELNILKEANADMQHQLLQTQHDRNASNMLRTRQTETQVSAATNNEIIAPPIYFSTDQAIPSPFDDIVPVRIQHSLNAPSVDITLEQPTIEDLQRNVSDLEKHAQDLETKLRISNQRETEFEDRFRQLQLKIEEAESRAQAYEQTLHSNEALREHVESDNIQLTQQLNSLQKQLVDYQQKLQDSEQLHKVLEAELTNLKLNNQAAVENQSSLEQLQQLLQDRETELENLKKALNEEIHLNKTQATLESQILPPQSELFSDSHNSNMAPSLNMFFGATSSDLDFENLIKPASTDPVVEEIIVPKKFYECQPKQTPVDAFNNLNLDDGWDGGAWGADEVVAEAQLSSNTYATPHSQTQSLISREQQLEIQIQDYNERIQDLELALERSEQQNKELQVKSSKMMKKLKDFKQKNLELQSSAVSSLSLRKSSSIESNTMFDDLDAAIQDELKAQVATLEAKLQESQKLSERQEQEKEKLVKRIDVLTAGSERMTEMKERQDMDLQMYQTRIRELQQKLNSFADWGNENVGDADTADNTTDSKQIAPALPAEQKELEKRVADLNGEVKDLSVELQELQALLDEEKSNAAIAQERVQTLQKQLENQSASAISKENLDQSKYNELKLTYQNLEEKYNTLYDEHERLKGTFATTQKNEDRFKMEIAELTQKLANYQAESYDNNNQVLQLRTQIEELQQAKKELQEAVPVNSAREVQLQTKIVELSETILQYETQYNNANHELFQLRNEISLLKQANEELQPKEGGVDALKNEIDTLSEKLLNCQSELHDTNSNIVQLRENINNLEQINAQLQHSLAQAKQNEASAEALYSQQMKSIQEENDNLKNNQFGVAPDNESMAQQLQEKESEIIHLKQRIEDLMREDQTEKLVLEILTKNQEIHLLKLQVKHLEDDKQELEHNLSLQIAKELGVGAGRTDLQTQNTELQQELLLLQTKMSDLQTEKSNMEAELQVLNNHVLKTLGEEDRMKEVVLELDAKNIEIFELRKSLEMVKESTQLPAQPDLNDINAQWENIVEKKCSEVAQMWQQHLQQCEQQFAEREARLQEEIAILHSTKTTALDTVNLQQRQALHGAQTAETTATNSTAASEITSGSSASTSEAASKQSTPLHMRIINEENESNDPEAIIEKMHAALESQEIEIVTLKEQLAIRSAEYARLAAQYDPFKLQNTLSHSGMNTTISSQESPQLRRQNNMTGGNDVSSVVPKSELDFALYMWHQRDMRCEEMTLELVSLLEERDTLQLKLSNTLRQVEELKTQSSNYVEPSSNIEVTSSSSSDNPQKPIVAGTTANVGISDELSHKLSQLQTVDHSKDKLIMEEREHRIRQMEKIQQDVAKIPSAAISELIGTDLSQTGQSPSSVLLNWLWGNKPNNSNNGASTS